jgi:YgiT-type zinc finger domain-containing protein
MEKLSTMIPEKCSFCKGKLYEGKSDFVVKVKKEVISINKVPAYICDNCGESYYTPEISRKIDKIMKTYHEGKFLAHPIAAGEIEFEFEAA